MILRFVYKYLLYGMIALVPFKIAFEISEMIVSPLEVIIYILTYLTIIQYLFRPRKINTTYFFMFFLFYLFTIPSKLSMLNPKNFIQGTWHITKNILEPLPLVFLLTIMNFDHKKRIKKAILVLIIFATIAASIGIIQTLSRGRYLTAIGAYGNFRYLGIYPPLPAEYDPLGKEYLGQVSIFTHVPYTNIFRAHGGLTRHNYFGAFLVLTSTMTLGIALSGKLLLYPAFLLQSIALIMTFTRAAYIGFIASLFLLFLLKRPLKKVFNLSIIIGMTMLFFLCLAPSDVNIQLGSRFETIFKPKDAVEMRERLRAYDICIKEIEKKPIFGHGGGGLENFDINGYRLTSHNDILETIYTRGVIAFTIIYFLYLLVLKDAFRLWKNGNDGFVQGFAVGFFSGFVGILVTGIAQPILMVPDTGVLIWLTMGLIVATKERKQESAISNSDKTGNSPKIDFGCSQIKNDDGNIS